MNYLYFSKKLNFFSAYLNLISSLGWLSLIFLIGYYHFFILNNPHSNYYYLNLPEKSFVANPLTNIRQSTPVTSIQSTNMFSNAFINQNGYNSFFSEEVDFFWGRNKYWVLIQPIFIGSIISSCLNLILSLPSFFFSVKAKSVNYLISSIANIFIPIGGYLLTMKIHKKFKLLWNGEEKYQKSISPGQLFKFKVKLILSKLFSEITVPA